MLVFISHSSKDEAAYSRLCQVLDGVLIPRFDVAQLLPGRPLAEQLRIVIEQCAVCIFLATPDSLKSNWCLAELGAFWGAGKTVVTFVADTEVKESHFPPQFRGNLWTNNDAQLINAVVQALREHRESLRHVYELNDAMDGVTNSMQIAARGIEALSGRWSGSGIQWHGHAGDNYRFPMAFGLVATTRRVFGTFEVEFPDEGKLQKAILTCSGGLFYGCYLRLNYEHVDEKYVHFGTVMAYLMPGSKTLTGNFLGYGGKTGGIVSGQLEVTKCEGEGQNVDTQTNMHAAKIDWNVYGEDIKKLRYRAFVIEQGFTASFINDDRDAQLSHVCVFIDDELVGCIRYGKNGHIERCAVKKEHRGKRVFRTLWCALENEVLNDGIRRVWGYAQQHNIILYMRVGMVPTGNRKPLDSIDHFELEKRVSPASFGE